MTYQDLIDARRWAKMWKMEAKLLREDYLALANSFLQDHSHLEAVIKELETTKIELVAKTKIANQLSIDVARCQIELLTSTDERDAMVIDAKDLSAKLAELRARETK